MLDAIKEKTNLMLLKKFQDSKDNVIDIAKARSFTLFSMMEAASPVDSNVTKTMVQLNSTTNRTTSVSLTKGVEAVKDRAIFTNIIALELPELVLLGFRGNVVEERNIIIGIEAAKIPILSRKRLKDLHVLKQTVMGKKSMGHPNSVGFHGVTLPVVVIADLGFIKVANFPFHSIKS